ncbi:MAG TPA: hypothetical protein VGJ13_04880 [Pseudonocardiaceae bacterium]|jgi:repressor LexA
MNEPITRRQRQVIAAITGYIREHGYPPSMREVGDAVGIASTSAVAHQLRALERKGRIRRTPGKPRAITIVNLEVQA